MMSIDNPKQDKRDKVSRAVGQTLATLQHLADLTIDWGFKKMKRAGEYADKAPLTKGKILPTLKNAGLTVLSFLGSVGDSYYDWYEKLKAKRAGK